MYLYQAVSKKASNNRKLLNVTDIDDKTHLLLIVFHYPEKGVGRRLTWYKQQKSMFVKYEKTMNDLKALMSNVL